MEKEKGQYTSCSRLGSLCKYRSHKSFFLAVWINQMAFVALYRTFG